MADGANHRIQVFTPDGTFVRQMGSFGSDDGQFSRPRHLRAAADGSVYAVDNDNSTMTKFDKTGAFVWRVPDLIRPIRP